MALLLTHYLNSLPQLGVIKSGLLQKTLGYKMSSLPFSGAQLRLKSHRNDNYPSLCSCAVPFIILLDSSIPTHLSSCSLFPIISHFFYSRTPAGLVAQSCSYSRHGRLNSSSPNTGKLFISLSANQVGHIHYLLQPSHAHAWYSHRQPRTEAGGAGTRE